LQREVGWLLTLEDAIYVAGRMAVLIDKIKPIGNQAAAGDKVTSVVHRGQFVPGRKRDDQLAMEYRPRARRHD
jgi:hypothetical protein